MRLTKKEKEALLELLDVATDRVPTLRIDDVCHRGNVELFWSIFKKLRWELRRF